MKLRYLFVLIFLTSTIAKSQTVKKNIRPMSYLGTGLIIPSTGMNKNAMVKSGVQFRFGHFQPLMKEKPLKLSGFYSVGIEVRFDYSKFRKDHFAPWEMGQIKYDNGTANPVTITPQLVTAKKKPDAFEYLIGPSLMLSWKRMFIQPHFLLGYASAAQEPFVFRDSIRSATTPSENKNIILYSSTHETNNGFVFVPGIKAGRMITSHLGFFIAADYSFGPELAFTDQQFRPVGNPVNGVYDFQQLKNGTTVSVDRKSRFRALTASFNLAVKW